LLIEIGFGFVTDVHRRAAFILLRRPSARDIGAARHSFAERRGRSFSRVPRWVRSPASCAPSLAYQLLGAKILLPSWFVSRIAC